MERGRGWSEKRDIGAVRVDSVPAHQAQILRGDRGKRKEWGHPSVGSSVFASVLCEHSVEASSLLGWGGGGGQLWSFQVYNVWHSHKAYAPFYDSHILFFL